MPVCERPQAWRWILLTSVLALLKFEVVPGRSISPMGIGLVLTAALHGPLAGGAAGIAAGLGRALVTGHRAFLPALPLSGLAIGWAATRIPMPLAGITLLWVALSSAPLMGIDSLLAGASDTAGLSSAVRSLLDALLCGMVADLLYPHLSGAWGPRPERRLPQLWRATYLGILLTTALLVGAVMVLHREHARLREAAHRVDLGHMRAHTQASATDVQNWLDAGARVARAVASEPPSDLAGFAAGARASTPDLLGLVLHEGDGPPRAWVPGDCELPAAAQDLQVVPRGGACQTRAVARLVVLGEVRATAWLDLEDLPSRIRAWTWVRELDNGRAWIEDGAGRVLVWSGGEDVWLPMPVTWTREVLRPDITLWTAPPGEARPGPHFEAQTPLADASWVSWVMIPPGHRHANLEVAVLHGLGFCLALGLVGLSILPVLLRRIAPEREAPLVPPKPGGPRPRIQPSPKPEPRTPHEASWTELIEDAVSAAVRTAGVARNRVAVETPPGGVPHAPPPRRNLGRSLHLLLDEALGASSGPWRVVLETVPSGTGKQEGVAITLLDPRGPPDEVELGALERPVERAGNYQALALARELAAVSSVRLALDSVAGQRRSRLILGDAAPATHPPRRPDAAPPSPSPAPAVPADERPVEDRPTRVLLAEDNEANRLLIQALIASRGWTCDVVVGARQAIEAAASGRYGLILMDLHMPDIDGVAATREIRRAGEGGARTPVVAITADLVEGTRERCLSAGMVDFLPKPVALDALAELVERYVGPPPGAGS